MEIGSCCWLPPLGRRRSRAGWRPSATRTERRCGIYRPESEARRAILPTTYPGEGGTYLSTSHNPPTSHTIGSTWADSASACLQVMEAGGAS